MEKAAKKRPAELYHIWWTSGGWRYTSHDQPISYGGYNYTPAALERGTIKYDSQFEVTTLEITAGRIMQPVIKYIAQNPVEPFWIDIKRILQDANPMDAITIFIGQIKNVAIKGMAAQVSCVGFEYFLRQPIPTFRYQPQCNWTIFDSRCGLDADAYKLSTSATVDLTRKSLWSGDLGEEEENWWVFGDILWQGHRRMIIQQGIWDKNTIYLRYPILEINQSPIDIDVWPGCDGCITTCRDKFNNVVNFGGHPYIPLDNPTLWE